MTGRGVSTFYIDHDLVAAQKRQRPGRIVGGEARQGARFGAVLSHPLLQKFQVFPVGRLAPGSRVTHHRELPPGNLLIDYTEFGCIVAFCYNIYILYP